MFKIEAQEKPLWDGSSKEWNSSSGCVKNKMARNTIEAREIAKEYFCNQLDYTIIRDTSPNSFIMGSDPPKEEFEVRVNLKVK